jgi:hypothetical protein
MSEITIVVSPVFDRYGKRRHGRFNVRLKDSLEIICEATQQPLLDAARIMLRRGIDPGTKIWKVRADAPSIVTMKSIVGIAAQFDVMGGAFVRRKAAAGPMPGSGSKNLAPTRPVTPRSTKVALEASHNGSLNTASPPSPTSSAAPSLLRSRTSATTTGN